MALKHRSARLHPTLIKQKQVNYSTTSYSPVLLIALMQAVTWSSGTLEHSDPVVTTESTKLTISDETTNMTKDAMQMETIGQIAFLRPEFEKNVVMMEVIATPTMTYRVIGTHMKKIHAIRVSVSTPMYEGNIRWSSEWANTYAEESPW